MTTAHPLNRGASPHGWHAWKPYLDCSQKAARLAGLPPRITTEPALLAGLIYHAFQEVYRSTGNREVDTTTIEFSHIDGVAPEALRSARAIAEKAFRSYRAQFAPDYYGKVIGTEFSIEGKLPYVGKATARLDLLVEGGVQSGRTFVNPLGAKGIGQDGEWAIDYKLEAGTADPMRYAYDPQFWWQFALRPTLAGIIVDIATKESKPRFPLVILPAVWLRAQQPVLANLLRRCAEAKAQPSYNSQHCMDFRGRQCLFLKTCPRHNTEKNYEVVKCKAEVQPPKRKRRTR